MFTKMGNGRIMADDNHRFQGIIKFMDLVQQGANRSFIQFFIFNDLGRVQL
jgi:hypothetical protein